MVKKLIDNGHESCLEHSGMTVIFICDRAIANELERHRLASYTQESTRYVNVKAEKLGADGEMQIILPKYLEEGHKIFEREEAAFKKKVKDPSSVEAAEENYALLTDAVIDKLPPEIARGVRRHSVLTRNKHFLLWKVIHFS